MTIAEIGNTRGGCQRTSQQLAKTKQRKLVEDCLRLLSGHRVPIAWFLRTVRNFRSVTADTSHLNRSNVMCASSVVW